MLPPIYPEVSNWWYHYYSRGNDEKIYTLKPRHFLLSKKKKTPDFEKCTYSYGICHYQIGESIEEKKSIILIKTTVGSSNSRKPLLSKQQYLVGYFRVEKIDTEKELVIMDEKDSYLLFDNPILINNEFAKKLFPYKTEGYWDNDADFVKLLGSTLRNKKASESEIRIALSEIILRKEQGAKNYFGENYRKLLNE
jgi:hypothetical protein